MALHAAVIAELDERSSREAADQMRRNFADAGVVAGREFRLGLEDSMSGANLTSFTDSFARSVAPELGQHGAQAGREFGEGLNKEIRRSLDDVIGGMTDHFGAFGGVAETALTGITSKAGMTALGVAGVGLATVAVGKQVYDLGNTWDSVADNIIGRTGKMGDDLQGIVNVIGDVGRTTAVSLEGIGNLAGGVSQSMDLSGDSLEVMTERLASIQQITGQVVDTGGLGKAFRLFDVNDIDAQASAVSQLMTVSQASEVPINELLKTIEDAGTSTRQFGLDFTETAGLVGAFNDAGVSSEEIATGLSTALKNLAADGQGTAAGLERAVTLIKQFHDAGQESAATNLAATLFGENYSNFLGPIEDGTLDVKKLHEAVTALGSDDAIDKQKDAVEDFDSSWVKLTNTLQTTFGPAAASMFNQFSSWISGPIDLVNQLATALDSLGPGPGFDMGVPSTPGSRNPLDIFTGAPAPGVPSMSGGSALTGGAGAIGTLDRPANGNWGSWLPGDDSGGSPGSPQIPYPVEYGQPPQPGESDAQWQARMANIAAQHDLAEKQALVTQLEASGNASADETTKAHNDVIEASMRAWQTEHAMREAQKQQLDVSVPYGPGYGAAPRPGQTSQQYNAESGFLEAQHSAAQAQAEWQQLQSSGTATAAELAEAQNKLAKAQRGEYEAQMRLSDAYTKTSGQLGEIGAKLDKDFGLSNGLPGLADNLIRFVAGLAAAPFLGPLAAISAANGGVDKTGSGVMGILASTGGLGSQYMPTAAGTVLSPSAMGPAALQPGSATGDANVNAMLAFAQERSGKVEYAGASDMAKGLADCSGSISDLYEILKTGQTTAARDFTTTNFASDAEAAKLGFLPGYQPGALNVGVNPYPGNSGHMAATLPNGVNFEGGGGTGGGAQYGGPASGALDPQFEKHYYLPVGPSTAPAPSANLPFAAPDLLSPENTNPGLNNPAVSSGGGGSMSIPGSMAGPPTGLMANLAAGSPTMAAPSGMPGRAPGAGAGGGGGFGGLSGAPMAAISAAASGLDMMAPGAGAAAQIGIQLANRGVAQAGKYGGIAVSGILETLSLNKSALADPSRNWIGRLATGVSGAKPATPSVAGPQDAPQSLQPGQAGPGQGGPGGTNIGSVDKSVTVNNHGATENQTAKTVDLHQTAMNSSPGW